VRRIKILVIALRDDLYGDKDNRAGFHTCLVFYKSITLTRFPAMFSTYSFPSLKASADGPSSLSGGFGIKPPRLVPFKSKTITASKCVLDAYSRSVCGSMARSSKPAGSPHAGTDHLVRNFPFSSNT